MRGSACGVTHRESVPCEPVAAEVAGTVNKFIEGAWFYHITVCAAAIGMSEIDRLVGGGKDEDGNCRKSGIGSEAFEQVAAVLTAEIQVQKNKRGEGVGEA